MTQFPAAVKYSFLVVTKAPPVGGEKRRGSRVGWAVEAEPASVGVGETLSAVGETVAGTWVGVCVAGLLHALAVKASRNVITTKIKFLFITRTSLSS
jgi:hypothetical protein